jgi:hypothetical protein
MNGKEKSHARKDRPARSNENARAGAEANTVSRLERKTRRGKYEDAARLHRLAAAVSMTNERRNALLNLRQSTARLVFVALRLGSNAEEILTTVGEAIDSAAAQISPAGTKYTKVRYIDQKKAVG